MINNVKQVSLFVLVSLLKQARKIDNTSFLITIAACGVFISMLFIVNKIIFTISLVIILLGIVEKYYAFRVSFDKDLFSHLMTCQDEGLTDALKQLDTALLSLKLVKNNGNQTRSLESRQQGILMLLKKQLICCLVQIMLLMMIGVLVII